MSATAAEPGIAAAAAVHHLLLSYGADVTSEWRAGSTRYARGGAVFAVAKPFARRCDVAFRRFSRARSKRVLSAKGRLPFLPYLVEMEAPGDLDTELRAWLRESYEIAGE